MIDEKRWPGGPEQVSGMRREATDPGSRERPADLPNGGPEPLPGVSRWEPQPIGLTKHEAAVRRSLAWADEAAALLDYAGALLWLAAIEATGDRLPHEYLSKQDAWALAARGSTQ